MNGNKSKINKSPTKNKKINPFNSKLKQNKEKRDDKVSSTKTTLGSSGKSLQKVTFKKVFKESNNRNQLNELENNDLNVLKREFSRSLVEFSNKNILKNEEKLFLEQLRFQQKTSFNSNILKTIKEQISDIIHLEETSKLNEIENLFHQSTCASPEIHLKRQTFCFNILPNKQNKKKNKEILKISFNDNDLNDDMDENMRISIPQNFYHCNSLKQVDLSNTRKVFSNTEVFKEKDKDKVNETISNKRTNLLNKR